MGSKEFDLSERTCSGKNGVWSYCWRGFSIDVASAEWHYLSDIADSDTLVGVMDFDPPGTKSEVWLTGLLGLQDFFSVTRKEIPEPVLLYGQTNATMAKATKRLGFRLIDGNPNEKREENKSYYVVGNAREVRKELEKLLARRDENGLNIVDVLTSRIARQKLVENIF